jgi:predicted O-methyltransferase YrrM
MIQELPSKIARAVEEGQFLQLVLMHLAPHTTRSLQHPMIADFLELTPKLISRPEQLLDDILSVEWRNRGYEDEFSELNEEVEKRYSRHIGSHSRDCRIEDSAAFVLYAWIRSRKPKIVLETGVANGHSSVMILSAMSRNGCGELHSTDVIADVGELIGPSEKSRWNYHLFPLTSSRSAFRKLLAKIGSIDVFFHDSLHTYAWQLFEYESVFSRISEGGLLASDDVDVSYAFIDFCRSNKQAPAVLLDSRKMVGFIRKAQ